MRVDVSYKYMEKSEFIDNVLDKNFSKIERRIRIFRRDAPIHISVHIEKNPHREQYFCRSHIYLPSKLIKAEERADTLPFVINKTFSALTKQLDKLKHRVEGYLRKKNNLQP